MPKRRNLRLLSGLLALGLLAAACGDDDEPEEAGRSTTTTEAPDDVDTGQVSLDDRCEEAKAAGVSAPAGTTVRLVTDIGKVDDRTFNQYAFEGMKAAEECFGITTSYIETANAADYQNNIATALNGDPAAIITVGFLLGDQTLAAAQSNPGTKFIGVDQFQADYPDNYVGVLFNEDEGGYLAGVLAASLTETGTVAVIGGLQTVLPVVKLVNGFEAGAKSVDPDVKVLSVYNTSFTETSQGEASAQTFINEGADVIFGAGGKMGSAGVVAATKDGVWGIGVDQDEYFSTFDDGRAEGVEKLASSAVKRVDLGVFDQIVKVLDGSFAGEAFSLTAANGGITYAPFHEADVPAEVRERLEATRLGLADGTIKTGLDPVTGLPADD